MSEFSVHLPAPRPETHACSLNQAKATSRLDTKNMWRSSAIGAVVRRITVSTRLRISTPCRAFSSENIQDKARGLSSGSSNVPDSGRRSNQSRQDLEWRRGDWRCNGCGHHVFASRQACPRCNMAKQYHNRDDDPNNLHGEGRGQYGNHAGQPGGTTSWADSYAPSPRENARSQHKPGDWDCPSCQFHNFASRHVCFRCEESRPRGLGVYQGGRQGTASTFPADYKPGDWECPSCAAHNFASRQECFRCRLPKTLEAKVVGADPHRRLNSVDVNSSIAES